MRRRISVASSMVLSPGASRDQERVVVDRAAVVEGDTAADRIEPDRLTENDARILVPAQDGSQGLGDVARRQGAGGDLVKQRLEEVVVAPVDERDLDRRILAELPRRVQPGEATTDDDDTMPASAPIPRPVRSSAMVCHAV